MKTKVLLIGPDCFGYNQSIASAFDSSRFTVKIIDYHEQYGRVRLFNKILFFISKDRRLATARLLDRFNAYILTVYENYSPDIVLFIKGHIVREETVAKMKKSKNILWMMDSIFFYDQSVKLAGQMDALFLFEKTDVAKIQKINPNSHYLPSAFDDKIYNPLGLKKKIDILFIGTLYAHRLELMEKIHRKFPELKLTVYCERFRFYKNPLRYIQSFWDPIFKNRFISPTMANKRYNQSQICLNMHHEQSVYGINPRFFEIAGTDSLLFTDHRPFIDDFLAGYKIHSYKTEDELFSMIHEHFYGMKKEIDRGLSQEIRMNHTYRNRIGYILNHI